MQGFILGACIGISIALGMMANQLDRIATALERQHAPQQHAVCKLT